MKRFLIRRLVLAVVTLFLLTLLVFFATHLLPGDVAKKILGPFADPQAVKDLNRQLGTDRPIPVQYADWIGDALRGDLGRSYKYEVPVTEKLRTALGYSARLAGLAFLFVVPVSILGGILAALRRNSFIDRIVTIGGLSAAVIPEFVWAVVFILVFGVKLKWFPTSATPPLGNTSVITEYRHLILPAACLFMVLFGYIARITRAGVIESLDSDYTRTARLKGLPSRTVVRRHVLRNALLPTIAVVATQIGYLIGGLVAVETIFNYNGFGFLLRESVSQKDYPLLQAAVFVVGVIVILTTFLADIAYTLLNPRIRQAVLG
jgi:peptide/nickel transport system permease protein